VSRTVNARDYAEKSNAILDVAERLIANKGYEQMTTQDILQDLQISRGAFYHYFESKQALLMALVERIGKQAEQIVRPIVADNQLAAQDKLLCFFIVLDQVKRDNKDVVFAFGRVWYADENALFRHKLYLARIRRLSPLLSQIIAQGVEEGAFTTEYPDQAARMIISLLEDLAYAFAGLVEDGRQLDFSRMAEISDATADALERLLGMRSGRLRQSWSEATSSWQDLVT
jgi:AcrR family transcriptional regulator